ncbi:MAG: nucleotidyltransferase domain-containing protein [Flavobacteriales bacterium]|jgi:predicted nucleotidyltransferase|nr:nucleotidyltransferase domain-containing protein [Flavobacteriales bacterium]
MKTQIINKLRKIEEENNIEILFAVESGSRAWGFASPDSDYDIRFVYKHKKDWYLNLWEQKDTIEFMTPEDLDGSGWDVSKALKLLAKSNASLLGWIFSPVIYLDNYNVLARFKSLAYEEFNPVAGFHHYHSMSKNYQEDLRKKEVNLKRFFYALRTSLSAKWILDKETVSPVCFYDLLELLDDGITKKIETLIEVKKSESEGFTQKINKDLVSFVQETIEENEQLRKGLETKRPDYQKFNDLFLRCV